MRNRGYSDHRSPPLEARILGVGTAAPPVCYSQSELLSKFNVKDRRIRSVFLNSAIESRYLTLPATREDGYLRTETQGELLKKHRTCATQLGARAITECLESMRVHASDILFLCCVTTTGFLSPGVSALMCRELNLVADCLRLDVVGMGCNGGLNALNAVSSWALANPGKLALLLCVEICSAGYVFDKSLRTGVVNSLFGDGAAAIAVATTPGATAGQSPTIMKFYSRIVTAAIDAMRYDWDETHGKFSF